MHTQTHAYTRDIHVHANYQKYFLVKSICPVVRSDKRREWDSMVIAIMVESQFEYALIKAGNFFALRRIDDNAKKNGTVRSSVFFFPEEIIRQKRLTITIRSLYRMTAEKRTDITYSHTIGNLFSHGTYRMPLSDVIDSAELSGSGMIASTCRELSAR